MADVIRLFCLLWGHQWHLLRLTFYATCERCETTRRIA